MYKQRRNQQQLCEQLHGCKWRQNIQSVFHAAKRAHVKENKNQNRQAADPARPEQRVLFAVRKPLFGSKRLHCQTNPDAQMQKKQQHADMREHLSAGLTHAQQHKAAQHAVQQKHDNQQD